MNSVLIGSGFGGIAAAIRLKAKGNNVTLIDYSYSNSPENYIVTFAYDYNEDDYPRQVIVNENGSSEQNIDIAYY